MECENTLSLSPAHSEYCCETFIRFKVNLNQFCGHENKGTHTHKVHYNSPCTANLHTHTHIITCYCCNNERRFFFLLALKIYCQSSLSKMSGSSSVCLFRLLNVIPNHDFAVFALRPCLHLLIHTICSDVRQHKFEFPNRMYTNKIQFIYCCLLNRYSR